MERTWELMGLNDGWKSEKAKVFSQNFKAWRLKKLLTLYFKNMSHNMSNITIFLFRMEL